MLNDTILDFVSWTLTILYYIAAVDNTVESLDSLHIVATYAECRSSQEEVESLKSRKMTELQGNTLAMFRIDSPDYTFEDWQTFVSSDGTVSSEACGDIFEVLKHMFALESTRGGA